ncbi:MAG: hypothetical protein EOP09_18775 [Proteobacteria bacterium]|nr:MAG: hypothetical protein EOP09_18775 [Pseudomonadota bacterium]
MDSIPASLKALAAMGFDQSGFMGPKWKEFAGGLEKLKGELPKRVDARIADPVRLAQEQARDLRHQLEEARRGRRRPLTELSRQEMNWEFEDATDRITNPDKPRSKQQLIAIATQRGNIRTLIREMEGLTKMNVLVDKVGSAFDNMFDSVLNGQQSFLGSMRSTFQSTLSSMASDLIKSQLRSGLFSLFGGLFGGKSPAALVSDPIGPRKVDGSFAVGIDRVPRDGFVGELHRGETVLSKIRADEYRRDRAAKLSAQTPRNSGGSGSATVVNNYVHNGNIVTNDPADYQKQQQNLAGRGGPRRSRFENKRLLAGTAMEAEF